MNIYQNDKELNLNQIHLTKFENEFFKLSKKLQEIIEPNFSSINELKNQNKDLLELAFNAELKEIK
jgi:hypothetical protein